MPEPSVTLSDIESARQRIAGKIFRTPVARAHMLSEISGVPVWLKLDHRQPTGSFKLRGATSALARLAEQGCRKVVTASTGNHGRAVAYAARALGIDATVCMSTLVPDNKVKAVRALGAEARIIGKSQDEAELEALRLVREEGFAYVPPFDYKNPVTGRSLADIPEPADDVVGRK